MVRLHYSAAALCVAATMLAGCGGSQTLIGNPGAVPQGRTITQQAAHGKSWMLPEAKRDDLLYVTNTAGAADVFSYPAGKEVGAIVVAGEPMGACVDRAGNVWIARFRMTSVVEYAQGVAVDKNGKIYVAGGGVRTYTPDGEATTPTIAGGGVGIAVDGSGKIYVAGGTRNFVKIYTPKGKQTGPTITAGLDNPVSLAVAPNGKIFVVNFGTYLSGPWSVTSYKADGEQTTPTITNGIADPVGVAIH
jgi:hypothetical protein